MILRILSNNIRLFPKLAVAALILGVVEWALTAWAFGSKVANIEAVAMVLLVLVAYGIIAANSFWFGRCQAAADGLYRVWQNLTAPEEKITDIEEGDYVEEETEWEDEEEFPEDEDITPDDELSQVEDLQDLDKKEGQ